MIPTRAKGTWLYTYVYLRDMVESFYEPPSLAFMRPNFPTLAFPIVNLPGKFVLGFLLKSSLFGLFLEEIPN